MSLSSLSSCSSRRSWAAVPAIVAALLLFAGGPIAQPSRAAGCDVSWIPADGDGAWSDGGDWGGSVPTSGQSACLPASGTPYTVTLTSSQAVASITIGAGATLVLQATNSASAVLTLAGSSDNSGTIDLTDTDSTGSGNEARVIVSAGTLTNDGTIVSDAGVAGLGTRMIDGDLTNASDGAIVVSQNLQLDLNQAGTFSSAGALTVNAGAGVYDNPGGGGARAFDITGGTITNNGAIKEDWGLPPGGSPNGNGTLSLSGGTLTGNPILANAAGVSFSSGGSETVELSSNCTLTGGHPRRLHGDPQRQQLRRQPERGAQLELELHEQRHDRADRLRSDVGVARNRGAEHDLRNAHQRRHDRV